MAEVYNTPFLDLVHNAAVVHRMYNDPRMVRVSHAAGQAIRQRSCHHMAFVHKPQQLTQGVCRTVHRNTGAALHAAEHQDGRLP